ncbi:hypothetical protein [Micromonospora sp. KC213]|uniref:hypothetical protein n=1 Tax=Micromonospora sp. KC213 TaxID=2530378 RepID=UPI00104FFA30|nr:hypothetical protein [Micromonospora sp. KC213]TDC43842.1 hypothetical protein E1166_02305 [Micromonospora sp. KC213]
MKPLVTLRIVPRTVVVGAWCVAGFLVMMVGGSFTEALFSRVGYPGAGWGGVPVTFDLAGKRDALDQLAAKGTLDLFGWVQVVDITIIIGTLLFFTALSVLAWRTQPPGDWLDRLGRRTTAAFVLAPTADAVENLTALLLIAGQPQPLTVLSLANSLATLAKTFLFIGGWMGIAVLLLATARRAAATFAR